MRSFGALKLLTRMCSARVNDIRHSNFISALISLVKPEILGIKILTSRFYQPPTTTRLLQIIPMIGGRNPTAFRLQPLCRQACISSFGGHSNVTSVLLSLKFCSDSIQVMCLRFNIMYLLTLRKVIRFEAFLFTFVVFFFEYTIQWPHLAKREP